jgi:hypothetical protein
LAVNPAVSRGPRRRAENPPPRVPGLLRVLGLSVVTLLLGTADAHAAPPDVPALLRQLTETESRLHDAPGSGAEVPALIEHAMALRADLIEAAGDDERAATWMVDQAEAVLWMVERDGAAASVVAGIPTRAQRERVRDAGERAAGLAARARDAADRAIRTLESRLFDQPGATPEQVRARAAEVEKRLAALVDVEQAWRIELAADRAAALQAAAATDALAPGGAGAGVDDSLALSLAKVSPTTAAGERSRRLALGAALMMSRRRGSDVLKRASAEFEAVAKELQSDAPDATRPPNRAAAHETRADPVTLAAAQIGAAACAPSTDEARAASRRLRELMDNQANRPGAGVVRLLLAEGAARTMLARSPAPGAARAQWEGEAISGLVALAESTSAEGTTPAPGGDGAWLQATVCTKLGQASVSAALTALDDLPGWVTLGRAVVLAAEPGDAPARAAKRSEAARLLERLCERNDAATLRSRALWELAVVLSNSADGADAARAAAALVRLATDFPGDARSRDAVENAAKLGRFATEHPGPGGRPGGPAPDARATYAHALEQALHLAPPLDNDGLWRCEWVRLRVEDAAAGKTPEASAGPAWLRSIMPALEQIVAHRESADPLAVQADALGTQAVELALGAHAVTKEWHLATDLAVSWAQWRQSPAQALCLLARGEALVDGHDDEALEVLGEAKERGTFTGARSVRLRLALGRGQRRAGRAETAFATLRTLAEELEPQRTPERGARPEPFWAAWAEMLEILAEQNSDGSRTATIRLQLNRLALIDKDLGPSPWRERIAQVRDSLR